MILVSDLHMGGGGGDDDFSGEAESALIRLLNTYPDEALCLVGDTFELWQASIEEIKAAHYRLIDLLYQRNLKRILGNHDTFRGYERLVVEHGGKQILLIHGHQFDAANKSGKGLGRYVTWVVGWLERNVHKDADRWLDRLYGAVKKRTTEYDKGLAALAKENICTVVVYGHTHFPGVNVIDGITVANCGTWTHRFENGYPYVKIDGNGVIQLKWWR